MTVAIPASISRLDDDIDRYMDMEP